MPPGFRTQGCVVAPRLVLLLGILLGASVARAFGGDCDEPPAFDDRRPPLREVFVDPDGSDETGDGSRARPFGSLARAARDIQPGTAIRLLPGEHRAGATLTAVAGTALAPVWIGGIPGAERPRIRGGTQAMHLSGARYVIVENLEIEGCRGNGINCDDTGDTADPEAARFLVFRRLMFRDIGTGGNQDGLKLSGVRDFRVVDCEFERGSAGGSGIDMVGCHRGRIARCRFASMGSNSIQAKGGTEDIEVRACRFLDGGQRAINMGGSTGFPFFRPPLSGDRTNAEARNIRVVANVFRGSEAPVAWVGCVDSLVANNTILDPARWVLRILQETQRRDGRDFAAAGRSRFVNNLVVFERARLAGFVNVGSGTAPDSCEFVNNLWYARDDPARSRPSLPVPEVGGVHGLDPLLADAAAGDATLLPGSPVAGRGRELTGLEGDLEGRCYAHPPSIGAWEAAREVP